MEAKRDVKTLQSGVPARSFERPARVSARHCGQWHRCGRPPLLTQRAAKADEAAEPHDTGARGRRYLIRGGAVMSMDPGVGDFARADVLIEGKKIVAIGPDLHAGGAAVSTLRSDLR